MPVNDKVNVLRELNTAVVNETLIMGRCGNGYTLIGRARFCGFYGVELLVVRFVSDNKLLSFIFF